MASDVYTTREYHSAPALLKLLPVALGLILVALVMWTGEPGGHAFRDAGRWIVPAAGVGLLCFILFRQWVPGEPIYVLSPKGLAMRAPGAPHWLIPWREILAVTTMEIKTVHRGFTFTTRDVPALVLRRDFYEASLPEGSWFAGRRRWQGDTVEIGANVKVPVHHDVVGIDRYVLRAEIERRWLAFAGRSRAGDAPKPSAGRPSQPTMTVGAGSRVSIALVVLNAALLCAIAVTAANVLGYWQTEGQRVARLQREELREILRRSEEDSRRLQQELRKRDAAWDKFWREFDASSPR